MNVEIKAMLASYVEAIANSDKEKNLAKEFYYINAQALLIEEGKIFESQKLSESELVVVQLAKEKAGKMKKGECYYNAQRMILLDNSDQIEYWEGYTLIDNAAFPIMHGFNVINGKVIDYTLDIDGQSILGTFPPTAQYIGIKMKKEWIIPQITSGKPCVSFIDNWAEGWPLLKMKWKGDE